MPFRWVFDCNFIPPAYEVYTFRLSICQFVCWLVRSFVHLFVPLLRYWNVTKGLLKTSLNGISYHPLFRKHSFLSV